MATNFQFDINTPVEKLTALAFFNLIKQAVREGMLEAHSQTSTNRADLVAKQLLGD